MGGFLSRIAFGLISVWVRAASRLGEILDGLVFAAKVSFVAAGLALAIGSVQLIANEATISRTDFAGFRSIIDLL